MPAQDVRLSDDNTAQYINRLDLGLDVSDDPDDIDPSRATDLLNVRFLQGQMLSDTGYRKFQQVVRGKPRREYRFQLANQAVEYLLITNEHVYKRIGVEWQIISNGTLTTADVGEPSGETIISLTSVTGFVATDVVGIILDDGTQHQTTIVSVNGPANDITITDPIPASRSVPIGAAVVRAAKLNGADARQLSIVTDPSNDFVIFTNGVDKVKKYDPVGGGSVTDLGGLAAVSVDTCRTLAIFNNSLFLGFTTEGGSNKPQRVRNSQVGNYELWTGGVAGFEDFFDREDAVIRLEPLGPFLIAYRRKSIRRGEWTNDPDDIVDWNTTVPDKGVVSHDAVVPVDTSHICVDVDDIYRYRAGFDAESLAGRLFHRLFGIDSAIRPERFNRLFAVHVDGLREVFIFWPDQSDDFPTNVARLKLPSGSWTLRRFPEEISGWGEFDGTASRTWLDVSGTWAQQNATWSGSLVLASAPSLLLGGAASLRVFEYDFLNPTDDGVGIDWFWTSKNFLHPRMELRVDNFSFVGKGGSVTIEYSANKGRDWIPYRTIPLSSNPQNYVVSKQVVVQQIMWRLSGVGSNFGFDWFAFTFSPEGEKR